MLPVLQIILILAVIFGVLWWKSRHPYRISRQEMCDALQLTLDLKMDPEKWHKLVHTPISRDGYLESIRRRLEEVPRKSRIERDGAIYDHAALAKIAALLAELKSRLR